MKRSHRHAGWHQLRLKSEVVEAQPGSDRAGGVWLRSAPAVVRLLHTVGKCERRLVQRSHIGVRRDHALGTPLHSDVQRMIKGVHVTVRHGGAGLRGRQNHLKIADCSPDAAVAGRPAGAGSGRPGTMTTANRTRSICRSPSQAGPGRSWFPVATCDSVAPPPPQPTSRAPGRVRRKMRFC